MVSYFTSTETFRLNLQKNVNLVNKKWQTSDKNPQTSEKTDKMSQTTVTN